MGRRLSLLAAVVLIALASLLFGCYEIATVLYTQSCSGDYCDFYVQGTVLAFSHTAQTAPVLMLTYDNHGLGPITGPAIRVGCTCRFCVPGDSLTLAISPSIPIGTTVHYTIVCDDPVLAEWPTTWGLSGYLWSNTPGGGDHLINSLPSSFFSVPGEFSPIVTDPGYAAFELDLGFSSLPTQTVYSHFQFRYNGLRSAYVKGIDVGTVHILESNQRFVFPPPGTNLDLTALHAPDPRVILLGPDTATPALHSSWGQLKLHYR